MTRSDIISMARKNGFTNIGRFYHKGECTLYVGADKYGFRSATCPKEETYDYEGFADDKNFLEKLRILILSA